MNDLIQRARDWKSAHNFSLYAQASGRWGRKIEDKLRFFGPINPCTYSSQAAEPLWPLRSEYLAKVRGIKTEIEIAEAVECCARYAQDSERPFHHVSDFLAMLKHRGWSTSDLEKVGWQAIKAIHPWPNYRGRAENQSSTSVSQAGGVTRPGTQWAITVVMILVGCESGLAARSSIS